MARTPAKKESNEVSVPDYLVQDQREGTEHVSDLTIVPRIK